MKDAAVIGLGNALAGDEGVGCEVVRRLAERARPGTDADFVDMGAGGMKVLHAIAGRKRAVLIDCAFMGEAPGTIRRFTPRDVRSVKRLSGLSLHEGDLLTTLRIAAELGECPRDVVIFGIEPANVKFGEGLSPVLAERIESYAAAVEAELAGTECTS